MRKTCLRMIGELADLDERVVFIGSDLAPGILSEMQTKYPERYFMEGVSEQHVIGMASGLAMNGYLPYINTLATFLTRRCFEQTALDAALHNLPLRLIGSGGGFVYAPLGPTHLAIDDFALMRAIPGMTILAVCDAPEMERAMRATLDWPHPLYIRMAKGGDRVVSRADCGFALGKAIMLRDGAPRGHVQFIATGVMTQRVLDAADELIAEGITARVLHMHTVAPIDRAAAVAACADAALIVTAEEHLRDGGLGSAILETLVDANALSAPMLRCGVSHAYPAHYGSQDDHLKTHGLQGAQLAQRVHAALAERAKPQSRYISVVAGQTERETTGS